MTYSQKEKGQSTYYDIPIAVCAILRNPHDKPMNDTYVDNDGYTEYTAYGKERISLFFFLTENIISTSDSHRINPKSTQNQ